MTDFHRSAAAYAAGALDKEHRTIFVAHLDTCTMCQRRVHQHRETLAEIAALHRVRPPAAVFDGVVAAIAATIVSTNPSQAPRHALP